MFKKNLFLRIFFYSILVVSSIHFINIKAMIESRFNSNFVFENFSARAADDLLSADLIVPKEPGIASNFTKISNGMININEINELDYSGYFKDSDKFSFSQQAEGFWGKNIGYFRFKIISPYSDAESVVYVVNNGEQYTYNLVDGFFEIDHPLVEKKDEINWSPINLKTQNLLIKFIDKDKKELGIKTLVISNNLINQKSPTLVKSDEISSEITPKSIINSFNGKITLENIILNKDGSTNLKELNFSKPQNIGNPALRYLDLSFDLSAEEIDCPNLSFLINDISYESSFNDFIINHDKENKKIKIYFAVAKMDADKNFQPYNDKDSIDFSVIARFTDKDGFIKKEKGLYVSFNFSDELVQTDYQDFPAEQVIFENNSLKVSNGHLGFNSDVLFYQRPNGEYLVDRWLNNKHFLAKDLSNLKELNPDCRYVKFYLDFNSKFSKFVSLTFDNKGEDLYYDFLKQDNNSVYVLNQKEGLEFYYPVVCLARTSAENYWKNISNNNKWKITYFDENNKKEFKYSFEVSLNVLDVCKPNKEMIELPAEAFYFEDNYLNKGSQKKSGTLYYNNSLSLDLQKKYIDQNVSKFSGLENLRYFKINLKPFIDSNKSLDNERAKAEKIDLDKTAVEKTKVENEEIDKIKFDEKEIDSNKSLDNERAKVEKIDLDKTTVEKTKVENEEIDKREFDEKEFDKEGFYKTEAEKEAADKEAADKEAADKEAADKINNTLKRLTFSNVENIKEFKDLVIVEKDSIYIPAFNYSSKTLKPYYFDQTLVLNFMDEFHNIYSTKLKITSKPGLDKKTVASSPVVDTKPVEPIYKETFNPITGELIKEKIEKNKESQTSIKENNKINEAQLLTEAQMIDRSPKKEIKTMLLSSVKVEKEDKILEKGVEVKHQNLFTNNSTAEVKISLKNYLAYGTQSTVRLGEGQRAATIINYTNVKGDIPKTESDIEDVLKIANNKTPLLRNVELESKLLGNFYRLNNIIEENDIIKIDKDNLILELNQFLRFSYGILSIDRDLARERWAIELFVKSYNKLPQTSGEWRIVNSWAYRNILIDQVENNLDWINTASSKYSNVTVDLLSEFFDLSKQ